MMPKRPRLHPSIRPAGPAPTTQTWHSIGASGMLRRRVRRSTHSVDSIGPSLSWSDTGLSTAAGDMLTRTLGAGGGLLGEGESGCCLLSTSRAKGTGGAADRRGRGRRWDEGRQESLPRSAGLRLQTVLKGSKRGAQLRSRRMSVCPLKREQVRLPSALGRMVALVGVRSVSPARQQPSTRQWMDGGERL